MKISTISTPVHNALGITTEVSATIEAEVQRIAAIRFDSFIEDIDALTVALYASHPSACAELLKLPSEDSRKLAAEIAKGLHFNPGRIPHLANTGYFNDQLRTLLCIAREDPDHGSKLVQVFLTMLEHQEEHLLDRSLVEELQVYLVLKDRSDGFLLLEQIDDEILVMPSVWQR